MLRFVCYCRVLKKYFIGVSMKKLIILLMMVVLCATFIFYTRNEEQFIAVSQSEFATTPQETTKKAEKKEYVNILIMSNNYSSIYHPQINLQAKGLYVNRGKKAKREGSKLSLSKESKIFDKSKKIKITADGSIKVGNGRKYRGSFYIYKTNSGLVLVNCVELEDYVAGVISSEMGNMYQLEALKAQAVCARTYIKSCKFSKYKKYNAIADDSTNYQVYNRIEPKEKSIEAAKKTKGQVMFSEGKLIRAYYFSTSCGQTTNYKIWGRKKRKYIKGTNLCSTQYNDVTDEKVFKKFIKKKPKSVESKCPFYRWNTYLTNNEVKNSVYKATSVDVGKIDRIEINERNVGGIAAQITIYGEKREVIINNQNQIRKALCSYYAKFKLNDKSTRTGMEMLPSAFIAIEKKGSGFVIFGGGFGHGSGMSQNGADEMAKQGNNYVTILKKFYHNIKISGM